MQPTKGFQIFHFPFLQFRRSRNGVSTFPQASTRSTQNVSVLRTIPVNLNNQRLTISHAVSIKSNIVKENTLRMSRMNNNSDY